VLDLFRYSDDSLVDGGAVTLTATDLQAMDVIGFDQAPTAVREPATWLAGLAGLLPLGRSARRRWGRRKAGDGRTVGQGANGWGASGEDNHEWDECDE